MLQDEYNVSGNETFEKFFNAIKKNYENTKCINVMAEDITVLSFEEEKDDKYFFRLLGVKGMKAIEENNPLPVVNLAYCNDSNRKIIKECTETTGVALSIPIEGKDVAFLVSDLALKTMFQYTGIKYPKFHQKNIFRDILLQDGFFSLGEKKLSFVYKENNGVRKIFACAAAGHKLTSSQTIVEIVRHIPAFAMISDWNISHRQTTIKIIYPDMRGCVITNSDIGEGSLSVSRFITIGGTNLITNTQRFSHKSKSFDVKEIAAHTVDAQDENMLNKVNKFSKIPFNGNIYDVIDLWFDAFEEELDCVGAKRKIKIKTMLKNTSIPILNWYDVCALIFSSFSLMKEDGLALSTISNLSKSIVSKTIYFLNSICKKNKIS